MQIQQDRERITKLRFADDTLLVATSLPKITAMLSDLSIDAAKVALQFHPDKTQILHNTKVSTRPPIPSDVNANGMNITILTTCGTTYYIGRKWAFKDPHRTELENRISTAWRHFHMLKQKLTGHRYSLRDRLRLFHGTVTPTILNGCEAGTLTTESENRLKRTQRQIPRMILHAPRRTQPRQHNHTRNNDPTTNTTTRTYRRLHTITELRRR